MSDVDSCAGCVYFHGHKAAPFTHATAQQMRGLCRRFPEAVRKSPEEWCGEFAGLKDQPAAVAEPAGGDTEAAEMVAA